MPALTGNTPSQAITEREFNSLSNDVEKLKEGHIELRTIFANHSQEQDRQGRMLGDIKRSLDEERIERKQREALRDHALKRTVWIASTLGPALLTTLWHLLRPK